VAEVREGVEAWLATGVLTLVAVASPIRGGQMVALEEFIPGVPLGDGISRSSSQTC